VRTLRRSPGFAAVAIVTLALGIGATTAIFTVTDDFLLRPLPFGNSGRIVTVKRVDRKLAQSGWADPPSFRYWCEHNQVFERMAAWSESQQWKNLTGPEGPERVIAKQASSDFFEVLGIKPVLGRAFFPSEDHVTIISYTLWQQRYGGRPDVLGKNVTLDREIYPIVGVLPVNFRYSTTAESVWTPIPGLAKGGAGGFHLNVIGLLKPGVTMAQVGANMNTLAAQLRLLYPDQWNKDQEIAVESLRTRYTRDLRPALLVLQAASALVLLIVCANLSNLLLARATIRNKEIAIRQALGASRGRLVTQMLTESLLLALLGEMVGLFVAFGGIRVLYASLPIEWLPLTRGGIDSLVFIFVSAISLLTVLLFSLMPVLTATGLELNECLNEGLQRPRIGRRGSFRDVLVISEITLATILVTGTGLLVRSFVRIVEVDLGFRPENVLTADMKRAGTDTDMFYSKVLDRIATLPKVRAAGAISMGPLSHSAWDQDITIEGRPPRPRGDSIWASHRSATIGYFRAMAIPLLNGRLFVPTDWEERVAIISGSMARRYWPNEDPVGKRFGVNCSDTKCNWTTVIGVVGDVKELGPTAEPTVAMYFPETMPEMTLVVRTVQDPGSLSQDLRGIVHSIDPDQPVANVQVIESAVSQSVAPQRLTMVIAGLFAGLALTLAIVGIYGVVSYAVVLKRQEFCIRIALGAQQRDILKLVLKGGARLAFVGLAIGIVCAPLFIRLASSLLYGVKPTDFFTFLMVSLILASVALTASYIPARRAMRLDPAAALHHE